MTKVVKCSFCKSFGLTDAEKVFKCRVCLKSKEIKRKKIYFEGDARECSEVLKRIREEEGRRNGDEIKLEFEDAG